MDKIKLILGDAVEKLKTLSDSSVDLIVADPPYNLGKDYIDTNDKMSFSTYQEFTRAWIKEANRVLKKGGTIYVFMGMRLISYLFEIMEQEENLNFISWITWHYTQGVGKKKGWSSRHDDILMFSKGRKYTFNLDAVRIPQKYYRSINNMRGANPGNVWDFSHIHYSQNNRASQHPTQKPEGVIERMILASSNENDVVLDPFSGSGTTMRVVQQLNRRGIGIEIEPQYIEETKQRLSEPFLGFDSIDERVLRIPNDLNDRSIRDEYLKNHINWFLNNHMDRLEEVLENFIMKYSKKFNVDEVTLVKSIAQKNNIKLPSKYQSMLKIINDIHEINLFTAN